MSANLLPRLSITHQLSVGIFFSLKKWTTSHQ